MSTWWAKEPSERYWLELTDRADIGADLRAPLLDDSGKDNWRYSLFQHARIGDVVFHYRKPAIIGYSVIAGPLVHQEITWGARGSYARSKGTEPHARPGYTVPLSDFTLLERPVTLDDLRKQRPELEQMVAAEKAKRAGALYLPFELSPTRDLRLLQGYAFKLPASFVSLLPALEGAAATLKSIEPGSPLANVVTVEATKNPPWSRDELIVALDLYIRNRVGVPGKRSPAVLGLSATLVQMGQSLGDVNGDTYRNANDVYMQLMNFRSVDPVYTSDGRVGLKAGNSDEGPVWQEFADDPARLAQVAANIRQAVALAPEGSLAGEEPDIQDAEEGRVLTRVHRIRERDRRGVEDCKARALRRTGRLTCAACDFNFLDSDGPAGANIIDVHHTKPVHTMAAGEKTRIDDLALLCANCHRVVHSKRKWLTIEEVRKMRQALR